MAGVSHNSLLGVTQCGGITFHWGQRTYIMGIVNVTPDSFSGDGCSDDVKAAVDQARRLVTEGADIIDIGGESTRPGASPVSEDEELRRVIPVLEQLAGEMPLSIDTYKMEVARRALDAGAQMINDVWGLRRQPKLAEVAADRKVPLVIASNQRDALSDNIMTELILSLKWSMNTALETGVFWENIIIDPGIGFGKTLEQNLEIMWRLDELCSLDRPILLGTSRKSMIGLVLDLPPDQRLEGTAATTAIGIAKGADIIRVHDVLQMSRVCRMSDAILRRTSRSN